MRWKFSYTGLSPDSSAALASGSAGGGFAGARKPRATVPFSSVLVALRSKEIVSVVCLSLS